MQPIESVKSYGPEDLYLSFETSFHPWDTDGVSNEINIFKEKDYI